MHLKNKNKKLQRNKAIPLYEYKAGAPASFSFKKQNKAFYNSLVIETKIKNALTYKRIKKLSLTNK